MMSQLSLEKKLSTFDKNWVLWEKMNLCEKFEFWTKKFIFHQISKIHEKWSKKVQFFQKKTKFCFARKKTSNYGELISKLPLESPESTLCDRKALNAPKSNLIPEARLKAKNVVFGAKISRLFHFQISKKARLKTVTKTKALTCAMRFYDSKQASSMISSHPDDFRALNAPFSSESCSFLVLDPFFFELSPWFQLDFGSTFGRKWRV